jgi:glycosyltransferase involved in cell wall biosynthesis
MMRLKRQRTVHTVCSVPRDVVRARRLLFADRVVAVSDHTADALTRAGVAGVRRIYPCIDPDRLQFAGENALAKALRVEGQTVVLYAGDIELTGVPHLLVELLAGMRRLSPGTTLVIAARNKTTETSVARRAVQEAAAAAGLSDGLRLLEEVERIDQLLALTTVAILPVPTLLRKMDIPLVLLEAMAQEIPIVVSDLPPLRELARDDCGITVPAGDVEALLRSVTGLLGDADRRRRMGRAGRSRVQMEFSIARAAKAYEDLYEEILA